MIGKISEPLRKGLLSSLMKVVRPFKPSSQSQDVIGYRIYRSINQNETGEIVGYKEADKLYLSYTDLDVVLGHKYYYSVVAVDRMNYESDVEVSSIVLEIEEETVEESENESSNNAIFIGAGLLGLVGLGGAGYYFIGNKGNEELITGIAEVVETEEILESDVTDSKFTEIDGELLCSACGSMFKISGEKICPSCGTFDE
jgi:rubrerythrin